MSGIRKCLCYENFFIETICFPQILYLSTKRDIFQVKDRTIHLAGAIKLLVYLNCNLKEMQRRSRLIFGGEIIGASFKKVNRVTFVWPWEEQNKAGVLSD